MNEHEPRMNPEPEKKQEKISEATEQKIEAEKMVEATKIKTVFSDAKTLEGIADELLTEGSISGFNIAQIIGGHVYEGKKTEGVQYSLEILLESSANQEVMEKVTAAITKSIGDKWDAPLIEVSAVSVNESLLNFVKRTGIEHRKYTRERRMRYSVSIAALLSVAGILGTLSERYVVKQQQKAAANERDVGYQKIQLLEKRVQGQIQELNDKIAKGTVTLLPNDMTAETPYAETEEILRTIRDVEFEMSKLVEIDKKK